MMLTKIQLRPASVMAHLMENEVTLFNTACLYDFVPPRETQAQSESILPSKSARPALPAVTAISPMMPMQTFNSLTRSHAASNMMHTLIANASAMPLSLKERPIMASTSLQETIRLAPTPPNGSKALHMPQGNARNVVYIQDKHQLLREKPNQQSYHLNQTSMSSMQFPNPLNMQWHSHQGPQSVSGMASASDGDICGDRHTNYGMVMTVNVSDSESEYGADRMSVAASSAISSSHVSS